MPTVFLLEDHQWVRQGLKTLLETENDCVLVGESGHCINIVDQIAALRPDILITDVSSSGQEFDTIRQIGDRGLATRVIMLSMYADARLIQKAIENGVNAFVLKEVGSTELSKAIRSVLAGQDYYTDHHNPTL